MKRINLYQFFRYVQESKNAAAKFLVCINIYNLYDMVMK